MPELAEAFSSGHPYATIVNLSVTLEILVPVVNQQMHSVLAYMPAFITDRLKPGEVEEDKP